MGCATFLGTFLTSYRLGIALLVAGFGSACVYFLSAWILRPAPIEPFADGEIGIIIDSNNEWFQRAIALKAASTPLAGRLAFRTAEELMGLPVEQETKDALRQGMKARLLVHEAAGGQVRLIVLDGPPVQSKSTPFVFYAEIYEWLLSGREEEHVAEFVVAYILYRREFYEAFTTWARQLAPSPEAQFLQGCAGLRIDEPSEKLVSVDLLDSIALFESAREAWGRWLFPDYWARTTHNLGIAYFRLDPPKSIGYSSAAIELRNRDKYPSGWAYTANNLALALAKVGRLEEAVSLLGEARDTLARISYTTAADLVQRNLAALQKTELAPGRRSKSSTISAEVEAARAQIRQLIGIPDGPFVRPGIHIAHRLLQATTISGDFYKIIPRQDGSVGITLVDVEGHGLAASTTALTVEKALFRAGANWGTGDAREMLISADALISGELGHAGGAVTMNFLEVDPYSKVVRYAGAGMPFPLLFRFGQSQPETLTAVGMYVGDGYRRVHVTPNRTEAQAGDGDLILMFTDGITEARDQRGRVFGQNGILAAVVGADRRSPEAVADAVLSAALQQSGSDQPADDQALLVIQIGTPPQTQGDGLPVLSPVEIGNGALAFELTNAHDSGQYMANLRSALMAWAALHLSDERRRQECWSTLVEAIQNALRYGCDPGEVIGIEFLPSSPFPGVEIVVSQPKRWEDWDLSLGGRRPSQELTSRGVGTLTMLKLANEVKVSDQGRRVHLKFFSGAPPAPAGSAADTGAPADLRLKSAQDLILQIKICGDGQGTRGLMADFINDRTENLRNCRIVVRDARSFEGRKQTYREGFGLRPVLVANHPSVLAGDQSTDTWLVRIAGDHLEVGSGTGDGILLWPKGDPVEAETWLLSLTITADNLDPWRVDLRLAWARQADLLWVFPESLP